MYDESGELVCTKPFPSMPTHFWNDEDGIKYHKAYFAMFQGKHNLINHIINCIYNFLETIFSGNIDYNITSWKY